MTKDKINEIKKAYENYALNSEYKVQEELLKYITSRIQANKNEIEKLIKIKNELVSFEEILSIFMNNISEDYKKYNNMMLNKENFISVKMLMPIGLIGVECSNTKEIISYYKKAIETRNCIIISEKKFDEYSVESLILIIIKEALEKFDIDENIITLIPYEEELYKIVDRMIYTQNYNVITYKNKTDFKYVYVENEEFKEEALKNENAEFLYGDLEEAVKKINETYSKAAVIYTDSASSAYKFINLVKSKNIFVNTNLQNISDISESKNDFYINVNIIMPMPKNKKDVKNEIEIPKTKQLDNPNTALEVIKPEGILGKIKRVLKILLKR